MISSFLNFRFIRSIFLINFLILSCFHVTNATHIQGMEIKTEHISGFDYRITVLLFRDCSGIPAPTSLNLSGSPFAPTLPLVSSYEVSDICSSEIDSTTCNNGPLSGYKVYVYRGIRNIGGIGATLTYQACCRNSTVNLNGQPNFYFEAHIGNIAVAGYNNSSPVFPTPRPVPNICQNSSLNVLNFAAFDPDGDSLAYSIVDSKVDPTTVAPYNPGFSGANPLGNNAVVLDSQTGIMTVNTNGVAVGNYVVAVQVEEYNIVGNLKGRYIRETQFNVQPCNQNAIPTSNDTLANISGASFNPGGDTLLGTFGYPICFDVSFSDTDTTDTLSIVTSLSQLYPNLTISKVGTNSATATICFTPFQSYATFLPFTITATDDHCIVPGYHTGFYVIQLSDPVDLGPDRTLCDWDTAFFSLSGDQSYSWYDINGAPIIDTVNFGCTNCASTWARPSTDTKYIVEGQPSGLRDTVLVKVRQGPPLILTSLAQTYQSGDELILCSSQGFPLKAETPPGYSSPISFIPNLSTHPTYLSHRNVQLPGVYYIIANDVGCRNVDTLTFGRRVNVKVVGNVTTIQGQSPSFGHVDLLKKDTSGFSVLKTTQISNGSFEFNNVIDSIVYFKAYPGLSTNFLATYHDTAIVADSADSVFIPECINLFQRNLKVYDWPSTTGTYKILGEVYKDTFSHSMCSDVPIENLQVALINTQGEYIGRETTNSAGKFQFNDVPEGTYQLWADRIGINQSLSPSVSVSSSNPIERVRLSLLSNQLQVCTPTSVSELVFDTGFMVYPNPTDGMFSIVWDDHRPTEVIVYSSIGQQVCKHLSFNTDKSIEVNLSGYNPGIYSVIMKTDKGVFVRKIFIQ
ncbi:MAG: T9SS type A sorting domain-containing protein [Salibacteraceae bacterium]